MVKATVAMRPLLRQLHIYLSFFIAPCLIFFAITGALQTFRIPDEKAAPVLVQKLARVHRDDIFALKPPSPPRTDPNVALKQPKAPRPKPSLSVVMMRWFFVLASALIVITTLMGLWMGLAYSRDRMVLWLLLLAGTVLPIVLLAL